MAQASDPSVDLEPIAECENCRKLSFSLGIYGFFDGFNSTFTEERTDTTGGAHNYHFS